MTQKRSIKTASLAMAVMLSIFLLAGCEDSSNPLLSGSGISDTEITENDGVQDDSSNADNNADSGTVPETAFLIGTGISDITGPVAEISTGYNSPGEMMQGLAMRLYSRAFIIESPGSGRRVVFVSADMLHLYQSIKIGVIKKLAGEGLGDIYGTDNVMISATHTHSAPSNISWYTLFNAFNGTVGFDELHYEIVVSGIVDSIKKAHDAMAPGKIKIAAGRLADTAFNRSSLAYDTNLDAGLYDSNVDDEMVLLRLERTDGQELGTINWFPLHGTSLGIDNHRIHGDSKGWASYSFEKMKGDGFIAAFAQGAMGDVSPNQPDPADITNPFLRPNDLDPSLSMYDNPVIHGTKQFTKALELYNSASSEISGSIDFRHTHLNFNGFAVDPAYIGDKVMPWDDVTDPSTCIGCVGGGFLAGDEEGAPVDFAAEGDIRNTYVYQDGDWERQDYDLNDLDTGDSEDALSTVAGILGPIWPLAESLLGSDQYKECHKEKFVLLPVGEVDDFWFPNPDVPFVPVIVPLQIFTIGDLAIVGIPFEVTTMLGRRIKTALSASLHDAGITKIVIAGMSNSYEQYITTREEYAAQHFEGAFNIFGPWAGAALCQELDRLAKSLADGTPSDSGPTPPDLSGQQFIETQISSNGVVNDDGDFGALLNPAESSYSRTKDTVAVTFQGAHPRTILEKKINGTLGDFYDPETYTFFEIQKFTGETVQECHDESSGCDTTEVCVTKKVWETIATDGDPYTLFDWVRTGGDLSPTSEVTVTWEIRNAEPGLYRIVYYGLAKQYMLVLWSYEKFTGISNEFEVQ